MERKEKAKKIREVRAQLGLSQSDIAEKIGVSQPTWGRAENGVSELKDSNLKKLEELFGINLRYITHGESNIFIEKNVEPPNLSKITLISGNALAGLSANNPIQQHSIEDVFFMPLGKDKEYYAIRVGGKSMEPMINEGSIVLLEEMKEKNDFIDHKPYVIIFEGIAFLKRVSMIIGGENSGKFKIESENENKVQVASGNEITSWYKVTHVLNQM